MNCEKTPDSTDSRGTCPRCHVYANFDKIHMFDTIHEPDILEDETKRRLLVGQRPTERVLAFRCQGCKGATLVIEKLEKEQWKVVDHWPHSSIAMPEYLPDPIQPLFREAASCLRANAPRGAAIMTRTTIEAALQERGAKGSDTRQRIKSMAGKLPQQLIDMAQEVRLGGNDAVHEFRHKWTLREAQELLSFLRLLLDHLYKVPQELRAVQRSTAKRRSRD